MDAAGFTPTPEMLDAVVDWRRRRAEDRVKRPLVPSLIEKFGLTATQAVSVIVAAKIKEGSS